MGSRSLTLFTVQLYKQWYQHREGRVEGMSGGVWEPSLSRLKQLCCRMCNHSPGGSQIVSLLYMISVCNFPFACLPTDQSLGTCVCFLHFCFCFFSWSMTEQYHYSGSNKKLSLEFLQKRASWCSLFGICRGFAAVGSLPSFLSFRELVLQVAVAWGMHTLPIFSTGDEIPKVSAQG